MRMLRLGFLLLLSFAPLAAHAAMVHKTVVWLHDGTRFHSVLVYDDAVRGRRPGLLMVPNWYGVNQAAIKKAETIAGTRYVILVTDLYGEGVRPVNNGQAKAATQPLYAYRAMLRQRMTTALAQLRAQAGSAPIDPARLAAIGFCFGGTAVLDLARSGANIAAVVSFHGGLSTDDPSLAKQIKARVLVMSGADDKGTMPDAGAFMGEMRGSGADWQFVVLGNAVHCFTETDQHRPGCRYDARAAARSYRLMHDWLDHAFAGTP